MNYLTSFFEEEEEEEEEYHELTTNLDFGLYYYSQKEYVNAEKYLSKCDHIIAYHYLGCYYLKCGKSPKNGIKYLNLCLNSNQNNEYPTVCINTMEILGLYYNNIKNYTISNHYYTMVFDIVKKNNLKIDDDIYALIGNNFIGLKKYEDAKKYYLLGVSKNNLLSMEQIGYFYMEYEENLIEMLKYLNLAKNKNSISACCNLSYYYQKQQEKYKLKYNKINNDIHKKVMEYVSDCLICDEKTPEDKNNKRILFENLGFYFGIIIKNYTEMKKYLLLAIDEYNSSNAMMLLGSYYWERKNFKNMKYYLILANKNGNCEGMNCFAEYCKINKIEDDDCKKLK
jgi:hypothetical protein